MPEGDTLHRTAAALHRVLAGHRVTRFDARLDPLARVDAATPITGRTIERCEAIGKHLLIHFSGDLLLRSHLRMHGSWHLYRHGERWRRPAHALRVAIHTADWIALGFDLPVAEFLTAQTLARHPVLSTLGPDLLGQHTPPEQVLDQVLDRVEAAGHRPVHEVLLDQRVMAGLGNVFKSELLFLSGWHPDQPAAHVPREAWRTLLERAVALLQANAVAAGDATLLTPRGTRLTTGSRHPDARLWVYGRTGLPCRRCATPIVAARHGAHARSTYWCPTCQPAPDPTPA